MKMVHVICLVKNTGIRHSLCSFNVQYCVLKEILFLTDKKADDEEPPAKLLDDLFCKTKVTPCIYWLPLTEEQVKKHRIWCTCLLHCQNDYLYFSKMYSGSTLLIKHICF